jgi:hypothetical protein
MASWPMKSNREFDSGYRITRHFNCGAESPEQTQPGLADQRH